MSLDHAPVGRRDHLDARSTPLGNRGQRDSSLQATADERVPRRIGSRVANVRELRIVGSQPKDDGAELAPPPVVRLMLGPDAAVTPSGDPEVADVEPLTGLTVGPAHAV